MLTLTEPIPMVLDHEGDKFHDGQHRRVTDRERRGSLESRVSQLEADIRLLQDAPTDVRRINFSVGIVVSIVISALTLAGMFLSLRADVGSVKAALDTQKQLTEERAFALKETISMMDKKQELQRLEIQGLKEMILQQRRP
jgi:hypothetical protein